MNAGLFQDFSDMRIEGIPPLSVSGFYSPQSPGFGAVRFPARPQRRFPFSYWVGEYQRVLWSTSWNV